MINYAYDVDAFTIWADMLIYNKCFYDVNRKYLVGYVSRRNNTDYLHSMEEVYEKYGDKIMANMDIPPIFSDAMGDNVLLFRTKSKDEIFKKGICNLFICKFLFYYSLINSYSLLPNPKSAAASTV